LYYVALTRAERTLHLIFTESLPIADVKYAKNFAEMTDFKVWEKYFILAPDVDIAKQPRQALIGKTDEGAVSRIVTAFEWQYAHAGYENLPVKSSPTQLLADGKYQPKQHFLAFGKLEEEEDVEEENAAQRGLAVAEGTAYHAFLEHFDFSILIDEAGKPIEKQLLSELVAEALPLLVEKGVQTELLSPEKLVEILSNPVFYNLQGMRLYKEQQFLVSLPVKDTYAKKEGVDEALLTKEDGEEMLFQGAIDLLAVGEKVQIIDYKYSALGATALKEKYQPQLDLYKLAVAKVMKIPLKDIHCSIVNIRKGFQVDMD
jgi:ATP-dependent exoDNAse (exonuclease V) beta subunit